MVREVDLDSVVMSLPSWERGLKFKLLVKAIAGGLVAPLVGARIEMAYLLQLRCTVLVAPLVGARIEIN